MTIANVTLNDTFDQWRVKTNQLIAQYDETNTLAVASFEYANISIDIASNVGANIVISNSFFLSTISDRANTVLLPVVNAIFDVANTASFIAANAESNSVIARTNASIAFIQSANAESNSVIALLKASNAESNIITFTSNVSQQVANILIANTLIEQTITDSVQLVLPGILANTDFGSAFIQANAALVQANTARDHANTAHGTGNAALVQANTARLHANNAFQKANAALANTSTTFAGNLNITGNLIFIGSTTVLDLL